MDTTDKQNTQTVREMIERSKSMGEIIQFIEALQKEVAELRGERQRLRDAVKKINDSIWEVIDYNQDGDERDMELEFKLYAILEAVSLLESGSGKEETTDKVKE